MAFPPEIILVITAHLTKPKDRLGLAICSRRLYSLLTPILYRNLAVVGGYLNQIPFARLARTLILRPHLALYARSLQISKLETEEYSHYSGDFDSATRLWAERRRNTDGDDDDEDEGKVMEYRELMVPGWRDFAKLTRAKLDSACAHRDEVEYWMMNLTRPTSDAWVALLLILLPNFRVLDIQYTGCVAQWVSRVLQRAATTGKLGSLPVLNQLSEVRISRDGRSGTLDADHLFHYPSLRRISLAERRITTRLPEETLRLYDFEYERGAEGVWVRVERNLCRRAIA
jgi:hypothetical protein